MGSYRKDGLKKRCQCRAWSKCKHGWHFNFHHDKRDHRYSLDVLARARGERPPTSKTEAEGWRDRLREEIRNGKLGVVAETVPDGRLTLGDVADRYVEKHVEREGRRQGGRKLMAWYVAALRRAEVPAANGQTLTLEAKYLSDITTADVEAVREGWPRREGAAKGGRVGADRALKRLRHLFNWAIEKGYAEHTPFRRHGVTVVHFAGDQARTRRLEPGEEARLLKHAPASLQALITAALETGMRKGELLALRWRDVKWKTGVLLLPADITKTNEARDVPVTKRLRAILDLRRHAPDGTEHPPEAFVFGNEVGEPVADLRDAWDATCTAAKVTDLHFHDLRREFASRLRETPGISDHHVRDWLGHADMATTSRYLATTRVGLQQARRVFDAHRQKFAHDSHKSTSKGRRSRPLSTVETAAKPLN